MSSPVHCSGGPRAGTSSSSSAANPKCSKILRPVGRSRWMRSTALTKSQGRQTPRFDAFGGAGARGLGFSKPRSGTSSGTDGGRGGSVTIDPMGQGDDERGCACTTGEATLARWAAGRLVLPLGFRRPPPDCCTRNDRSGFARLPPSRIRLWNLTYLTPTRRVDPWRSGRQSTRHRAP